MIGMYRHNTQVALHYRDEGEGRAVLLLHGVGSDLESWDGVLACLAAQRRYIRFDLRGHGKSARTPGPYSLADFVDDTIGLIDDRQLDRVALIGFSLGGLIAQAVALTHPERVTCLVLISTVGGRTPEEQAGVAARTERLAREGARAHLADAVERWFTPEFAAARPEILEMRRQKSLQNHPGCYVAAYRVLAYNDPGNRLHLLDLPVLVMTGEHDIGSSARMARFIHEQIAGSELHILPRLKHSVLLEAPELVASLIDPFLTHARISNHERKPALMTPEIRKYAAYCEDVLIEGLKPATPPLRLAAIAAVLRNPWAGRGFVEDLRPEIHAFAPFLGKEMVARLMKLIEGSANVEAFGKTSIVGVNGEIEHGSAFIHTLRFGNFLRDAVQSSEFIPFTNKRGGPGNSITMPLKHITKPGARSHFLTLEYSVFDAPAADEILVAIGVASGGRPHHRIGDRFSDMEELQHDQSVRPDL